MDFSLLKGIRPLVIEDEKDVLESLFSIFDTVFDEFYTARNGEEGLYRFYKDAPDIIITDLQMPFMSGFRMIERIRIENGNVPIIIMSAHSQTSHIDQAKELHVHEYFIKPYDMDELFKKIYHYCIPDRSGKIDLDQFTV
ncbi:response regulator [Sulfurospirillum arsenophilum]|uniref:response regulator n=1 Tax=Sulfurospirillum arsenophilum TaxID=56698 RepID=UPI0006947F0E|nr:response regulator [Sulfurospirillum arsenophilum]